MQTEAFESSEVLARQFANNNTLMRELGTRLRISPPPGVATVARGSSDHAANYLGFLTMAKVGKLTTSLPMSLVTLYGAPLQVENDLIVAISQSGQSPDVVEPINKFKAKGAKTVALVNQQDSPLGKSAEWVFPLMAGEERAVAATKSYIASLAASVHLVAHWTQDARLLSSLQTMPEKLAASQSADWQKAVDVLKNAENCMVIGRGFSMAIAMEAALKLKETCGLQAEAFSSAEVKHGPLALIEAKYPVLIFATRGPAQAGLIELAKELRIKGADVILVADTNVVQADLHYVSADSPELDPLCAILNFYKMVSDLSLACGWNPDSPRNLSKVTKTF